MAEEETEFNHQREAPTNSPIKQHSKLLPATIKLSYISGCNHPHSDIVY